jgi:hypothetical protein
MSVDDHWSFKISIEESGIFFFGGHFFSLTVNRTAAIGLHQQKSASMALWRHLMQR